MQIVWDLIKAFAVGGIICAVGQILIDKTKLTPARILVIFVLTGLFLSAIGIYEPLAKFAGAGATVPLLGFGHSLAQGVKEAVQKDGLIGVVTGGLIGTAAGIGGAIFFSFLISLFANPGDKN